MWTDGKVVSEHPQWGSHSRTSCQGSCSPTTRKSDWGPSTMSAAHWRPTHHIFVSPSSFLPRVVKDGFCCAPPTEKKIPRGIKIVRGVMSGQEGLWGVEHVQSFVYLFIYPQQSAIQAVEGERDGGSRWTQTSTDSLLLSHLMPGQSFQFQSACP